MASPPPDSDKDASESDYQSADEGTGVEELQSEQSIKTSLQGAEELRQEGNDLFRSSKWNEALFAYKRGLALLPKRKDTARFSNKGKGKAAVSPDIEDDPLPKHDLEPGLSGDDVLEKSLSVLDNDCAKARAVLNANIAASLVKLGEYPEAVKACSEALLDDSQYVKVIQRRAQCNEKIGSWSALSSAQEDYNALLTLLPPSSPQIDEVKRSLRLLQPRVESAQKKEMDEMMGKLKGIGNSILGNFGLSTDNFKLEPNGQGGYSMNFSR
ncbi:hypothetical protein BV25DRAFT_1846856 [Artomyces pyxidatus]|uniref:Uncharacterized protein n=1 Tax=Artomyces pyxidatus TaxID=48021 RepID=A0ACB8TGX4_9AGAM|nr:hypothetical protein BV25DRAFT_1846856 [Artomyces pyxidatus]